MKEPAGVGKKWRFLIDGNLPPKLCGLLQSHGHHAAHIKDLAMEQARDIEIWKQANREHAIIVTKDKDFASLAVSRADTCPVILVRTGNVRSKVLLGKFEGALSDILQALDNGETLIELT